MPAGAVRQLHSGDGVDLRQLAVYPIHPIAVGGGEAFGGWLQWPRYGPPHGWWWESLPWFELEWR
jgi:hypothetical protein